MQCGIKPRHAKPRNEKDADWHAKIERESLCWMIGISLVSLFSEGSCGKRCRYDRWVRRRESACLCDDSDVSHGASMSRANRRVSNIWSISLRNSNGFHLSDHLLIRGPGIHAVWANRKWFRDYVSDRGCPIGFSMDISEVVCILTLMLLYGFLVVVNVMWKSICQSSSEMK